MADVNIQQPATTPVVVEKSGGSGAVWAVVVVVLLAVIAWFVFGGGFGTKRTDINAKVDVNTPAASTPAPAPSTPPAGGTKRP